jgi:ABC-type multidrug transport system fused ATPase/permease subunit
MTTKPDPAVRVLQSLFFHSRRAAFLLVILMTAAAGFDIAVPFITQRLVDSLVEYFRHGSSGYFPWSLLIRSALGILIATAAARALRSYYNYQLYKTATSVEDQTKCHAFENYLKLHALYHKQATSGQIIGRIDRGSTAVYTILFDIFGQSLLPPLAMLTLVFGSLLLENTWIALVVLAPAPLYLITVKRLTGRIYQVEQQVSEDFEAVSKESYDIASNVLTVKKFSQEREEVALQQSLLRKARGTQYEAERLWAVIENVQTLIATLGRVGVIVLGGWLVYRGAATVGEFVLFVTLQNMAYVPVSQLSIIFPRLRRNVSRAERLYAVIDEQPQIVDGPNAIELAPLAHSIEFRSVGFRYAPSGAWTLRNINLKVPAGTTVALVGRSGSGKTTFVNLLLRSFEPLEGSILLDGTDLREIRQESLNRQVAVVPQEVDLFSRTISENIAYGKPGATRREIEDAARSALAHDFIARAESGYQTVVGERGAKLSGGERQRIGIARAILRNPRILVFDEATSHLDTESERCIQEATERVAKGRTAFIIAHRLSTVRQADMIVVFDRGSIEAVGRHGDLYWESPTYRMLYDLHLGREPEPEPVAEPALLRVAGD